MESRGRPSGWVAVLSEINIRWAPLDSRDGILLGTAVVLRRFGVGGRPYAAIQYLRDRRCENLCPHFMEGLPGEELRNVQFADPPRWEWDKEALDVCEAMICVTRFSRWI